ncbi:C-C motif chemokine 20b [Esox lucius]|uniref:Chemokine (C-C motif) ligand 20b n=1 Tax=Esox lucius TaxID=8010 RepID=A0AAY5L6F7_ESOLU|nr:C-C motif chemokine 20b [Esox lucius]
MLSGKVCILAGALSFLLIATFIPGTQAADCCLKYTRRPVGCKRLKDYTLQDITSSCDLNAVIFHTRRLKKFICADPTQAWTQSVLKCLKKRINKTSRQKKKTSGRPG